MLAGENAYEACDWEWSPGGGVLCTDRTQGRLVWPVVLRIASLITVLQGVQHVTLANNLEECVLHYMA